MFRFSEHEAVQIMEHHVFLQGFNSCWNSTILLYLQNIAYNVTVQSIIIDRSYLTAVSKCLNLLATHLFIEHK